MFQKRDNSSLAKRRAFAHNAAKGLAYSSEAHTEHLKATLYQARCSWQTIEDTRGHARGFTNKDFSDNNRCKASDDAALLYKTRINHKIVGA